MPKYHYSDYTKNYFNEINSESKSYILGLFFADGNVYKNSNTIKIKLHRKDDQLLCDIKNEMRLENPIKRREYNTKSKHGFSEGFIAKSSSLIFTNSTIKKDLISKGCIPDKSKILDRPTDIPHEFIRHFIRGYVDGDGSFFEINEFNKKTKKNYTRFGFEVLGTKKLLNYLVDNLPTSLSIKKDSRCNVHFARTGSSSKVLSIGNYLYKNNNIALDRKEQLFKSIKPKLSKIKNKRTKVKNKETGKVFNSIKEAAKTVNVSYNTVCHRLKHNKENSNFVYLNN